MERGPAAPDSILEGEEISDPAAGTTARRAGWQTETVTEVRQETLAARTLDLEAPGWAGHDAGHDADQHVELRLRLPDRSPAVRGSCPQCATRRRDGEHRAVRCAHDLIGHTAED